MSSSLRDQLLKAGLVTDKQVKAAERQGRKSQRKPRKSGAPQTPTAAQQAHSAKAAHDRELNRRKTEKAEAKARAAQIRQIIDQHRVPVSDDATPFYFHEGAHIKRIYVDAEQRPKIIAGSLIIAHYRTGFALLPPSIAEKVRERDPSAIVDLGAAAPQSPPEDADDAYKGFEVPDDLMW